MSIAFCLIGSVTRVHRDLQARGKVFLAALVMIVFTFCIVSPGRMIEFGLFIAVFFVLVLHAQGGDAWDVGRGMGGAGGAVIMNGTLKHSATSRILCLAEVDSP